MTKNSSSLRVPPGGANSSDGGGCGVLIWPTPRVIDEFGRPRLWDALDSIQGQARKTRLRRRSGSSKSSTRGSGELDDPGSRVSTGGSSIATRRVPFSLFTPEINGAPDPETIIWLANALLLTTRTIERNGATACGPEGSGNRVSKLLVVKKSRKGAAYLNLFFFFRDYRGHPWNVAVNSLRKDVRLNEYGDNCLVQPSTLNESPTTSGYSRRAKRAVQRPRARGELQVKGRPQSTTRRCAM